jgi:hypothetical protein
MTITAKIVSRKLNQAVIKVVGTAASDTVTIPIKTTLSIAATGNLTFSATNNTIVRSSGSWVTDGVEVGDNNTVVTITGTVSNNGSYIVKAVDATTITVETKFHGFVPMTDETVAGTATAYKSMLLQYGQKIVGNPSVAIPRVRYSVSSSGAVTIVRNSETVLKLFGHDELETLSYDQPTSDIVVTFDTSAGGTLIMELSKLAGFTTVNPLGTGE